MTTVDLQKVIRKNFLNKLKMDDFQFTKSSEHIIKQLYSHLLKAEIEWANQTLILGNLPFENMFSGSSYNYIPQEIRTILQKAKKVGYTCQLNINDRKININIILPINPDLSIVNLKKYKIQQAKQMVKQIFLWLFIAEKYACNKCSKEMNVFLYMTDEFKILPRNGDSINSLHANTAFTTPCSHSTNIQLFRKEEWFKVFIHETFHNLGLDFSTMTQEKANPKILTLFPLNIPDIRVYESYCETWAELLNIMFTAYWTTKNKRDINTILTKMEEYLDLERVFSLFQCTKVLHHYQLKYTDIYQNKTHMANLGKLGKYKEETNAFSYYILKPILLFHLNEFIQWADTNNNNILDFKKTPASIMKYCGLIEHLYDTPEYLYYMEKVEQLYDHNLGREYQTMRMTITEV